MREEEVSWRGTHRAGLDGATTHPRPFDGPFRIWHGSATSTAAVDLAAKWGDPLFSANALQPRETYLVLIDRPTTLPGRRLNPREHGVCSGATVRTGRALGVPGPVT